MSEDLGLSAVYLSELGKLVDGNALLKDFVDHSTFGEFFFGEPSPRPFPRLQWVNIQGIERHRQSSKSTEGWFVLCPELFREMPKGFHVTFVHGGSEKLLSVMACESNTVLWQFSHIEILLFFLFLGLL